MLRVKIMMIMRIVGVKGILSSFSALAGQTYLVVFCQGLMS